MGSGFWYCRREMGFRHRFFRAKTGTRSITSLDYYFFIKYLSLLYSISLYFILFFLGLVKDSPELIELVLTGFKEKILENSSISKTSKMSLFSVFNLKMIISLYEWKGISNDPEEVNLEGKAVVNQSVTEFLLKALTSVKHGLVFHDPTYGTSGSNQNHLLLNLIQGMQHFFSNFTNYSHKNRST